MNPSDPQHPWSRLTAAARTVRDDRDPTAPYGFATRVAALALGSERRVSSLLELFAFRAVAVASLLALASVAVNYKSLATGPVAQTVEYTEPGQNDDPVSVVLDITD
jgi:hypothetical protein